MLQIDFGDGKLIWNGVSGYIEDGESIVEATVRETREELGIEIAPTSIEFKLTKQITEELSLHVMVATQWSGDPSSQEDSIKSVAWFDTDKLPYDQMFEGNEEWLPGLLK